MCLHLWFKMFSRQGRKELPALELWLLGSQALGAVTL
jgi:hypothetical protein